MNLQSDKSVTCLTARLSAEGQDHHKAAQGYHAGDGGQCDSDGMSLQVLAFETMEPFQAVEFQDLFSSIRI